MKFSTSIVVALAAGLIAVTPALAQSTTDTAKPTTSDSMKKQPTQGAPAGYQPQKFGTDAKKQGTAGAPAGYEPQKYGAADAKKQSTAGAPAGYEPQKYGSSQGAAKNQ